MEKKSFKKEFYSHLLDKIVDGMKEVVYEYERNWYYGCFHVDGCVVYADVKYEWELHDESFDHAFGTWHDPNAYLEAVDVIDISGVSVYDEETEEKDERLFDIIQMQAVIAEES